KVATDPMAFRTDYPELHAGCIEGEFFVRSYLGMIPHLGESWTQHLKDCYELAMRLPNDLAGKRAFGHVLNVMKKEPQKLLKQELDFGNHPLFGFCIVEALAGDKVKLRFTLGRTRTLKIKLPVQC